MEKQGIANGFSLADGAQFWAVADRLRSVKELSDCKLRCTRSELSQENPDSIKAKRSELLQSELAAEENLEESIAENVSCVPREVRWSQLQAEPRQSTISQDMGNDYIRVIARDKLSSLKSNASPRPTERTT